jgi:hypothetical protein
MPGRPGPPKVVERVVVLMTRWLAIIKGADDFGRATIVRRAGSGAGTVDLAACSGDGADSGRAMAKNSDPMSVPRVELSDEHQDLSREELVAEHRRRVSALCGRAEFRDDLDFRRALEDDGLTLLAMPSRLAPHAHEIGCILALKDQILMLSDRP